MSETIKLTIAMIVKNEEKNLPRCLEALKPLMDQVKSELIITDTGSTDRTVEIARQYTDKVLFFEWCNDFAAARNTALEIARGEWLLFLDADEVIDDAKPMIRFLLGKKSEQYNSVMLEFRNYKDEGMDISYPVRLIRRTDETRFKGIIHESLPFTSPVLKLDGFVHHYGYKFEGDEEQIRRKYNRNMPLLLKAHEENPKDVRTIYHLINECYPLAIERQPEFIEKGYQVVKKNPKDLFFYCLYAIRSTYLLKGKRYQESIETIKEYFECRQGEHANDLSMMALLGQNQLEIGQYQEAIKSFEEYERLYRRYKEEKLDRTEEIVASIWWKSEREHYIMACFEAQAYIKLNDYEKAFKRLKQIDFKVYDAIGDYLECIECSGNYAELIELYDKIRESLPEEQLQQYVDYIQNIYETKPEIRFELTKAFGSLKPAQQIPIFRLYQIRYLAEIGEKEAVSKGLEYFKEETFSWSLQYADLIYASIIVGLNIESLIQRIEIKEVENYIQKIKSLNKHMASYVLKYCEQISRRSNIQELHWLIEMIEKILVDEEENKEEQLRLVDQYITMASQYMRSFYKEEVLNDEQIQYLPSRHQFIYYMSQAKALLDANQQKQYVVKLHQALESYPVMQHCMKLLIDQMEQQRDAEDEFYEYAAKIKIKIAELIDRGMKKEAYDIIKALEKIMPYDTDLIRYMKLLE